MSYTKHGFEDGHLLTGQDLDEMEDGILVTNVCVRFDEQTLEDSEKAQAKANLGIADPVVSGTTLII